VPVCNKTFVCNFLCHWLPRGLCVLKRHLHRTCAWLLVVAKTTSLLATHNPLVSTTSCHRFRSLLSSRCLLRDAPSRITAVHSPTSLPPIHLSTHHHHPPTHPVTHSPTHSLAHPLTHPLGASCSRRPRRSSVIASHRSWNPTPTRRRQRAVAQTNARAAGRCSGRSRDSHGECLCAHTFARRSSRGLADARASA
jgi:hypothetical protein